MDLNIVSVHEIEKYIELGQFPVILNLHLVNVNNVFNTEISETCLQSLTVMSCLLNVCFLFYCYEILVPLIQSTLF